MNSVRHRFGTGAQALGRFLALLVALTALLLPGLAQAGTLQVRDGASLLSASDRSQIQAAVSRYPFDVRVVTSTAASDKAGFARYVAAQVNEANEIVVGIDPTHRFTEVRFGTGSRIPASSWSSIESAGNGSFKSGDWGAGVSAIVDRAGTVAGTGTATGSSSSSSSGGGFALGGIVVLLLIIAVPILAILAIVRLFRRFSGGPAQPGYGGPGYGGPGPGYGGPGYGGPGPGYGGPGYGSGGGMGPVGGGLIGAGLGGIAGYELGKMEGEREGGGRREEYGGGGNYDQGSNDGGSFDAGGGGSSWDSGDSGGGGGGDSGGGGGGSDW